jgi:hypothetical protein
MRWCLPTGAFATSGLQRTEADLRKERKSLELISNKLDEIRKRFVCFFRGR